MYQICKCCGKPKKPKLSEVVKGADLTGTYGHAPGNLANMKEGKIDVVISSPPYAGKEYNQGGLPDSLLYFPNGKKRSRSGVPTGEGYGTTPGQLGAMKEGAFDMCVSSPPWENCLESGGGINVEKLYDGMVQKWGRSNSPQDREKQIELMKKRVQGRTYGEQDNNLGNSTGDTFWQASKTILEQCYLLLKDNGKAIFVCKDYVKAGRRVPFSDNWQALCESVGFTLECRHKAMLVKNHGKQRCLNGEIDEIKTERKSFFRRLAEKKGSPRIDHEDVICMVKHPAGG